MSKLLTPSNTRKFQGFSSLTSGSLIAWRGRIFKRKLDGPLHRASNVFGRTDVVAGIVGTEILHENDEEASQK
jgi:hypothetical protein